ncbi:MAG: hypothetical protein Q4G62_01670 [Pseudomonadota bacterium]|nr:hypothetical protein [Pseudomonadota bacterium]
MSHTAGQLGSVALASSTSWAVAIHAPFDALGITTAVLFMAMMGVAAGLMINPPSVGRGRLFGLAFSFTVASAALATVLAEFSMTAWLKPVTPPIALLIGFFAQALLPEVTHALKKRAHKLIGGDP